MSSKSYILTPCTCEPVNFLELIAPFKFTYEETNSRCQLENEPDFSTGRKVARRYY